MSAARHLSIAPTSGEMLCDDIKQVCAQIDRRLGNRPGTAERGTWFWHYPPDPEFEVEVLAALHRDAVAKLHTIVTEGGGS